MTSGRSSWLLRFLGVLIAMPAASRAYAQAHLYEHDNFRGRSYAVNREAVNLARVGFNDVASSLVIRSGRWQLCSDAGFQGRCVTLGPGRYPSLRAMGLNEQLSSLRQIDGAGPRPPPPPPPRPPPPTRGDLVLYEHDNFAGRSLGVVREVGNFASVGFNDIASSLIIRSGRWQLCRDAGFQGPCVTLGPGRYPSLRTIGLNDQLSSVRRVGR
jgi:Beta/Gamma crystallin